MILSEAFNLPKKFGNLNKIAVYLIIYKKFVIIYIESEREI